MKRTECIKANTQTKYIDNSFCLLRMSNVKLLEMIVFVSTTHCDTLHMDGATMIVVTNQPDTRNEFARPKLSDLKRVK